MNEARLADDIKALALGRGFHLARVASADEFPGLEATLNERITAGHTGGLDWYTPERAHIAAAPRRLLGWCRSILSLGLSYYSEPPPVPDDGQLRGRVARYAWGEDYHALLKEMMTGLVTDIERLIGRSLETRRLVDTARIVERAVAERAGLGWYGKHTCIIASRDVGSYFVLAEIPLDLDLPPDAPVRKSCGACERCMVACPTHAIPAPYVLHTPRCISYLTIEHRGSLPAELRPLMGNWVFGCDVCQDVCPPNRHALPLAPPALCPRDVDDAYPALAPLLTMDTETYTERFRGRPAKRARREGLARNAAVALGNSGDRDAAVPPLVAALRAHDAPRVRGHAAWALGRLGGATARTALDRARGHEPDAEARGEIAAALAGV